MQNYSSDAMDSVRVWASFQTSCKKRGPDRKLFVWSRKRKFWSRS